MLKLQPHEIEAYLQAKGRIRRRGQKAEMERCPFCTGGEHSDKWTCVVYLDATGGNYKCMRGSCAQSGSFWQLAEHFGDDPKDFYQLAERPQPNKPLQKQITFKTEPIEPQKLTDEALAYFQRRGLGPDVFDDLAVWCDEKGNVNFGYYHKGECCMVKVRAPRKPKEKEPKAWQAWQGGLRTLWGLEQCDPQLSHLVITFGEYDRIVVMQAGVSNAVSVPCGDSDLEWISVCYDELAKYQQIYLWIDNDKSGQDHLPKIAERLGKERVRVVRTDFKDANEMLVKRMKEVGDEADREIFQAVFNAEWYYTGDIVELADIETRERSFEGYLSGFKTIDKALSGFLFGSLTVHTGDSKHGKSSGVNQITATAIDQGARVCVWSGEDQIDDYKYKIEVHVAGGSGCEMKVSNRTGRVYAQVRPEYREKVDGFIREKLFVLNRRFGVTEESLFENFDLAYRRHGCDVFVIDNLMKLVAAKDTQNVNFRQAQIINRASDFAKDNNVHVHIVTHTNKLGTNNEPPTKMSVSGAKEITNLADNVIAWWKVPEDLRDDYGGADSLCAILANRVFGDEPTAKLMYDQSLKRYGETREELLRDYKFND